MSSLSVEAGLPICLVRIRSTPSINLLSSERNFSLVSLLIQCCFAGNLPSEKRQCLRWCSGRWCPPGTRAACFRRGRSGSSPGCMGRRSLSRSPHLCRYQYPYLCLCQYPYLCLYLCQYPCRYPPHRVIHRFQNPDRTPETAHNRQIVKLLKLVVLIGKYFSKLVKVYLQIIKQHKSSKGRRREAEILKAPLRKTLC